MDEYQAGARENVERIIRQLGFGYSYRGTNNLVDAVLLCYREPEALTAITKRVYPEVARQAGTNWRNVERNLRTTVEAFWDRGNRELLNRMVGYDLRVRPSVGEIISYIVNYVREQAWNK